MHQVVQHHISIFFWRSEKVEGLRSFIRKILHCFEACILKKYKKQLMDFYRGIIVPSSNPTSKILKADPFCMLTAIFTSVMDLNTLLSQVPALILIN